MILCIDCVSVETEVLPHFLMLGDLPGWVSQDISAVKRKDAGPRLQLALGSRKQGIPAGRQHLVLEETQQGFQSFIMSDQGMSTRETKEHTEAEGAPSPR